jgi:hypothetical protein
LEFKIQTIEKLFYYIVTFSYLLLPLCFFFIGNKKKEVIPVIIALYGVVCCCFLFYYEEGNIPKDVKKYFQTSYTFFEYGIFTLIFWINFRKDKIRWFLLSASVLFFAFQLFYVFTTKTKGLDSVPIGIETILILVYVIYFFYSFSNRVSDFYIYNHYVFWIAVGILIYLGGSFFFFILFEQLSRDQKIGFGNLTYLAEVIKNLLFVIALFTYTRYPFENFKKKSNTLPYLDMI